MKDIWSRVSASFPGVRLESEVQGWAFLEEFGEGLSAFSAIPNPSPKDDRWAGVCLFQLLRDQEALELLERAVSRGEDGARVYLAHVLPFLDRGEEAMAHLAEVNVEALSSYDQALYFRILSIREESNGNLREALRAAEEAWRRIQGVPEYIVLAPSILAQLAVLHGRIGRAQRALWFLERALLGTSEVQQLKVLVRRSAVLVNLGRYREAEVELESVRLLEAPEQFHPERNWLLGEIALARTNIQAAVSRYRDAIELAQKLQFSYEEFLCRLPLASVLAARGDFVKAREHLKRAQALITDKSDRLIYRFREVLINSWSGEYRPPHALKELDGLVLAFEEMGLLQEQAVVRLHRANAMRNSGVTGWERELDELQALSISLQNPALLAREWPLLPDLHKVALHTHSRIAGQSQSVLQVFTVGEERLTLDGEDVHIPLRRGLEVLAYFLEHKAVALRDVLEDVFSDERPSAAKSYFHQFRHQLREHLKKVEIEYDSEAKLYRLRSEIDIIWDVTEMRAGRNLEALGAFLPTSASPWARRLDSELNKSLSKRQM